MKGHDMAKKATAGEREADGYYQDSRRDGYQDRTKLARRIDAAIRRAVKAHDVKWLAAVKAHAPMNWLTVFGAVLDTTTTPAAHQTGKVKARTNIKGAK